MWLMLGIVIFENFRYISLLLHFRRLSLQRSRHLTPLHIRRWTLHRLRQIALLANTLRLVQQVSAFPVLRVLSLPSLEPRIVPTFVQLDRTRNLAP